MRHSRHLTQIIVAIRLDHYEALASIQTHNLVSSSKNFILYVSDQNASRQFYQEILDLQPVLDVPGMTEFLIGEDCKLGLMPNRGIAKILGDRLPHPDQGVGIPRAELYLSVENTEISFARAIQAGAKAVNPVCKRDWGDTVGYVADRDGHMIAFAERM